jgi:glycosyltransferase involved in cell wall biosynthesis
MTEPRVALLIQSLTAVNGVAEYYRGLLPHLRRKVDVVAIGTDRQGDMHDVTLGCWGLRAPRWTPEVNWLIPAVHATERLFRHLSPTMVHITDISPVAVAGLRAARRLGIPVVATFHTDLPGFFESVPSYRIAAGGAKRLVRVVFGGASSVSAHNPVAAASLARLIETPVSRIAIVRPGVNSQRFAPSGSCCERSQSSRTPRVLTVSRLSPEKQVGTILKAHHALSRRLSTELWVVGRGPSARRLYRRANANVVFPGLVLGDDLARAYREADVFVLAGPAETSPQALLEAQASGLPCVVSPSGAARQAIRPGVSGLVAASDHASAFAHALGSILESDTAIQTMSKAAREFALRATWERAAGDVLSWYARASTLEGGTDTAIRGALVSRPRPGYQETDVDVGIGSG